MLKFSDGLSFDTQGPLRVQREYDGLYVVGRGMLIPVASMSEARRVIASLEKRDENEKKDS